MLEPSKEILNDGLLFALEFGPNLNQPINQRLKEKFPELEENDLVRINKLCYAVRDEGVNFVFTTLGSIAAKKQTITGTELEFLLQEFLAKYLWVSPENRGRIFSQGCYYAWKDGFIEALTS